MLINKHFKLNITDSDGSYTVQPKGQTKNKQQCCKRICVFAVVYVFTAPDISI